MNSKQIDVEELQSVCLSVHIAKASISDDIQTNIKMEAPMPMLDLDESPVQGQLGSCVLNLRGEMVRGQVEANQADILYRMLVEAGSLSETTFRRMTVTFPTVRYSVARDEEHIYIVQSRSG